MVVVIVFTESDGERTFLSDHGVEYSFQKGMAPVSGAVALRIYLSLWP